MSKKRYHESMPSREAVERELIAHAKDPQDNPMDKHAAKERAQVKEVVYEVDPFSKALTGRTPERLEQETGISKEELFPENQDILYVGDPWQRMGLELDNERMFIIDYDFGESAEFITDQEGFLQSMMSFKGTYNEQHEGLAQMLVSDEQRAADIAGGEKQKWCADFLTLVKAAHEATQNVKSLEDYERAADAWQKARECIEITYKQETEEAEEDLPRSPGDPENNGDWFSNFRKQAWYHCVYAERGFRDIPVWLKEIKPKIDERRQELEKKAENPEIIEHELAKMKKGLIDEHRLRKKPENAHVLKAVFPELPFKDNSFDRFVASWSISAHVFACLDKAGFHACWGEIFRVLKCGGKAYIFPLNYGSIDGDMFFKSLDEFCAQTGMRWKVLDSNGDPLEGEYLDETLLLEK